MENECYPDARAPETLAIHYALLRPADSGSSTAPRSLPIAAEQWWSSHFPCPARIRTDHGRTWANVPGGAISHIWLT